MINYYIFFLAIRSHVLMKISGQLIYLLYLHIQMHNGRNSNFKNLEAIVRVKGDEFIWLDGEMWRS